MLIVILFFFKHKTSYDMRISDWSSDVCSSDLRPIIGHILADVAELKPEEVRLVVGYRGDTVERYARSAFPNLPVRIVWQNEQLGLGHAEIGRASCRERVCQYV